MLQKSRSLIPCAGEPTHLVQLPLLMRQLHARAPSVGHARGERPPKAATGDLTVSSAYVPQAPGPAGI
eukprot:5044150-Pyramimonas_sp.AAC.1